MIKTDISPETLKMYTFSELWKILQNVDIRLRELQDYSNISKNESLAIKEVKANGFFCLKKPLEVKDPNVLSMDLYANVYVYTWGEVNEKDIIIGGLCNNSDNDWVDELCFDFAPTKYKQLILPESSQAWDQSDPYNAIAKFKVQVLYLKKPFPGKNFRYINSTGMVKEMIIIDDKMFSDDKYFGDLSKWDTYKLFVL